MILQKIRNRLEFNQVEYMIFCHSQSFDLPFFPSLSLLIWHRLLSKQAGRIPLCLLDGVTLRVPGRKGRKVRSTYIDMVVEQVRRQDLRSRGKNSVQLTSCQFNCVSHSMQISTFNFIHMLFFTRKIRFLSWNSYQMFWVIT